jgi:hypothetical protein
MNPPPDLVLFFEALARSARAEYEALAQRDLRFGEDVAAELAETNRE